MAVSSTTNTVYLLGNGSTVVFPYPYYFAAQTDLKVHLYDTIAGGITSQVLNSNYSIVGTPNSQGLYVNGANIQFTSSVVNTSYVVIDRQTLQEQEFAILQTGAISSTGLVNEFDYLTLIVQGLQDQLKRTAKLPDGFGAIPAFNPALPSTVNLIANAGYILAINSGASGFQLLSPQQASGGGGTFYATSIIGVVAVANGGTGVSTAPTQYGVAYGINNTGLGYTTVGIAGQVLTQTALGPVFQNLVIGSSSIPAASITGVVNITQGGTGNSNPPPMWSTVIGSNAGSYGYVIPGAAGTVLTANASSAPSYQVVTAAQSGVVSIALGGTGQVTALAAFNALSPITTGGQLIVGSGTNNAIAIGAGSSGTVLQSFGAGQIPGWVNATAGLSYTANQYGLVVSGSSNSIVNVIPANSSTVSVLTSQGTGANPAWTTPAIISAMTSSGDMIAGSSTLGTPTRVQGNSSAFMGYLTQTASGGVIAQPIWFQPLPVNVKVFNPIGSATYTPPANVKAIKVICIGGGGGGGGTATASASSGAGGGGGAGGVTIKYLSGSSLLSSYPYTVGAAGIGGTSGSNNGTSGSTTFFGSSVLPSAVFAGTGNGGGGSGANNLGSVSAAGGQGGFSSGGDLQIPGANGLYGVVYGTAGITGCTGGYGAYTGLGYGGPGNQSINAAVTGAAGVGYGSGGNGGAQLNNGGAQAGGNAGAGVLIIEEYM